MKQCTVDAELCAGHGVCCVIASELFEADEGGYNAHRGALVAVPEELVETAQMAMDNCPEQAIFWVEAE